MSWMSITQNVYKKPVGLAHFSHLPYWLIFNIHIKIEYKYKTDSEYLIIFS